MADKKTKSKRGLGSLYRRPGSSTWYICYSHSGKTFRESTGTTNETDAADQLKKRLGEIAKGTFDDLKSKKLKLQELFDDMVVNYKENGKKSLDDLQERWDEKLKPVFGHLRVANIRTPQIVTYRSQRLEAGAAPSTVNREVAVIKRMLNLGIQNGKIQPTLKISLPDLEENNRRMGFVKHHEYEKLSAYFAGVGLWMSALFETAHAFGFRVSELLKLKVNQIDLNERVIRLEQTKSGEPRNVKMTTKVFHLIKLCCEGKTSDDYVFTRFLKGRHKRIVDFRVVWENGCKAAGVPDLLFHDLRRTGARNLRNSGVPETTVMAIGGWKTRSVFERYVITDENDLADATAKLERYHQIRTELHEEETAHLLHKAPESEKAQPARVGLTH